MTRKWFGLLIVAGMAVYSLLVLPALPAEIPIHWNLAGEPDSTMPKAIGAFLSALVFVAMTMIPIAYSYLIWRDPGEDRSRVTPASPRRSRVPPRRSGARSR